MKRMLLVLLIGLTAPWVGANPAEGNRFTFVAFGCMPYGEENFAAYDRLIAEINRHAPAFTVHLGDTKSGGEPPTMALMQRNLDWFNALDNPLIYTPGDNEWTDVHRESNGSQDPAKWLGLVRAMYYPTEQSLGAHPMALVTQRRDPDFAEFVENARWTLAGVIFATLHIVGSNNNDDPLVPGAQMEFVRRNAANLKWLRETFAQAEQTAAPGIAFFFQANPFVADYGRPGFDSGYREFLQVLESETRAFGRPVLVVHADEHRYRFNHPMAIAADAAPVPNLTRLETFGARNIHAAQIVVDPDSAQLFLTGPLLVPTNGTPSIESNEH